MASLPAASLIGTLTTWRAAFAVAAVFAVIAVAAQLAAVPRLGAGGRVGPRSLLTVVTLPVSRISLVAASAIFFANFAAYTYIGPLLHARAGLAAWARCPLLSSAGASISSPLAGSVDLARERGQEAPAPSQGAIDGAGNSAQGTR